MSIFKRLSTTVAASVDKVVGEIENHDAVIEATIHDLKKKIAEAQVRLDRVRRDANSVKRQIEQNIRETTRWQQRAIDSAKDDEQKALACVRRASHCEQQALQLEDSYQQYKQTIDKLSGDIQKAQTRANDMQQKHSLMRARQSSTAAMATSQASRIDIVTELDETFDRWELKLRQSEIMHDSVDSDPLDSLEQAFIAQEEAGELREKLSLLLKNDHQENNE